MAAILEYGESACVYAIQTQQIPQREIDCESLLGSDESGGIQFFHLETSAKGR
jgi:hypothetical protein